MVGESSKRKRRTQPPVNGDFELRHWKSSKRKHRSPARRPPALEIPNGESRGEELETARSSDSDQERGYVSLRDILTSPEYAAVGSPIAGGSCGEINIKNPLVKHAAYAYLQPTPSARETRRRRSAVRGLFLAVTCGGALFAPCLEFIGSIFRR